MTVRASISFVPRLLPSPMAAAYLGVSETEEYAKTADLKRVISA